MAEGCCTHPNRFCVCFSPFEADMNKINMKEKQLKLTNFKALFNCNRKR